MRIVNFVGLYKRYRHIPALIFLLSSTVWIIKLLLHTASWNLGKTSETCIVCAPAFVKLLASRSSARVSIYPTTSSRYSVSLCVYRPSLLEQTPHLKK